VVRNYLLTGLGEDRVFHELARAQDLRRLLGEGIFRIVRYGFTQILGNALQHSKSAQCRIELGAGAAGCTFRVRDFGVGIFHSLRTRHGLRDEDAALAGLLAGCTAAEGPHRWGGGIFFTAKAADRLRVRSHHLAVTFGEKGAAPLLQQARFLRGTEVLFSISGDSRRELSNVFGWRPPAPADA